MQYMLKIAFLFIIFSHYLYSACSITTTVAKEPLKLVNNLCLEDKTDHANFKNIYFADKYIYVAKGSDGFDMVEIKHVNYPIANSIQMIIQDTRTEQADFITADNTNVYLASNKSFKIYTHTTTQGKPQVSLHKTISIDMNATYMHNDDRYVYIGGSNQMKIYSKNTNSVVYDYNDIDGNITSITSKDNRVYVATNNNKIEVLAKNHIGNELILAKVQYNGFSVGKSANNLFINKQGNISFASKDGSTYGVLSAYNMASVKQYTIDATRGSANTFINIDNFNIISSSKGLFLQKESGTSVHYDSFNSADMVIYDEFIIAMDKGVDENNNQELKLRAYKVNSVGASKVFGYPPLDTRFHIDTINIKEVEWIFGDASSYSIKTRYPSYMYKNAGVYKALAKVTYESGRVYANYVHIIIEEKSSFGFSITSDKYSGAIPFDVSFHTNISNNINISSIEWDFADGSKSYNLNPVHTFNTVGDFNVSLSIKNTDGVQVTKVIDIATKTAIDGEIIVTNEGSNIFINSDIKLSLTTGSSLVKYKWSVGNETIFEQNPTYQFKTSGTHKIQLLAYDIQGVEYFFEKEIEVFDYKIPLISKSKIAGESPLRVDFAIQVPSGMTYELNHIKWTLPNNTISQNRIDKYTFDHEGLFKIGYEYRLSNGYFKKSYFDVNISNKANITASSDKKFGISPLSVNFEYNAIVDTGIKEYEINFGDGSEVKKTNNTNIRHTFTQAKDYIISISATSNRGHTTTKEILISVMDINASYNTDGINLDELYANSIMPVNFRVNAKNAIYLKKYKWDFGDGTKSEESTALVSHTYSENRTYVARLNITFNNETTSEKIFFITRPQPSGNLQVYKGWNLIGNLSKTPIKKSTSHNTVLLPNQNYLDLKLYSKAASMWIYQNNIWYRDPEIIDPENGIWIDMSDDDKLPFYGKANIPILTNLTSGWHLLATGVDVEKVPSYKFKEIMKFDAKNKKWVNKPDSLKAGDGFLVYVK